MRSHSLHWKVQSSLRALAVSTGGGPSAFGVYIFSLCVGMSLFDCFKWALIDCIVKCRGHSELWQFQRGVHLPLVSTCFLYVLVFPYLTVSNGHSLTALKSIEVTQSSGSFKRGGTICLGICILIYTGISLYFLISWLFWMGSHWQYENAWLSLSRQAVSNGHTN